MRYPSRFLRTQEVCARGNLYFVPDARHSPAATRSQGMGSWEVQAWLFHAAPSLSWAQWKSSLTEVTTVIPSKVRKQ